MNALSPLGYLYGRIMDLRNRLYDRDVLKSYSLGVRTISVGNLTMGGTGKTPLVILIAEILTENGEKVCVLTRGYGRENARDRVLVSDGESVLTDARSGGDEPVEIAYKLEGKAVIVSDSDRVTAGLWARENFGITTFILDDGFQNRRVKRDLDIVCIDATNPFGNGRILPAGLLRESSKNLSRAEVIVITRADQIADVSDLESRLHTFNETAPIFKARTNIVGLNLIGEGSDTPVGGSRGRLFAFTGIGNPENFYRTLEMDGLDVVGKESFRDHHQYTQADADWLELLAEKADSRSFVTTRKDAVKIKDLKFSRPCYAADTKIEIDEAEEFRQLVMRR